MPVLLSLSYLLFIYFTIFIFPVRLSLFIHSSTYLFLYPLLLLLCLSVCVFVWLCVCVIVTMSACPFISWSAYLDLNLFFHLSFSVYLYDDLSVLISVKLPYLFVCYSLCLIPLSIHSFVRPSVCPSVAQNFFLSVPPSDFLPVSLCRTLSEHGV